jgi:NAD(P)H dehydrogenase (quinone)
LLPTLFHFGMVVVGLPYKFQGQMRIDQVLGGSPYGAGTIAGGDGSREPSTVELDAARFQGGHVASIAALLAAKIRPEPAVQLTGRQTAAARRARSRG